MYHALRRSQVVATVARMSVCCSLIAATQATLAMLRADPSKIHDVIDATAPDEGAGAMIDLDKSWQALHYLLTGEPDGGVLLLGFLCCDADGAACVSVGDEDIGYGPAMAISPQATAQIAAALEALGDETLFARYQPRVLTELDIYPTVIWERDGDDARAYVAGHAGDLRAFLAMARRHGLGLLRCYS